MSASLPTHAEPAAPAPDPALTWRTTADWIEAEDGTIVTVRPGYMLKGAPTDFPMRRSEAAWPERRCILGASAQMLAALERVRDLESLWDGIADNADKRDAYLAVTTAITQARAT